MQDAADQVYRSLGWLPCRHPALAQSRQTPPTTYSLVATGPGGVKDASARVSVNPIIASSTSSPNDADLFQRSITDVFFDFDKSNIRPDEVPTTQNDASFSCSSRM